MFVSFFVGYNTSDRFHPTNFSHFWKLGCISVATQKSVLHYTKHLYVTADERDDLSCVAFFPPCQAQKTPPLFFVSFLCVFEVNHYQLRPEHFKSGRVETVIPRFSTDGHPTESLPVLNSGSYYQKAVLLFVMWIFCLF